MPNYPMLCPRCKSVTLQSAVENAGSDDKPFCLPCYFDEQYADHEARKAQMAELQGIQEELCVQSS